MSNSNSEDGRRDDDRVVGNPQAPLPEPWFIREARERSAARPVERVVPAPVMPQAAAVEAIPAAPPADRRWRTASLIALGILAAIFIGLALIPKQGGAPPVADLPEDGSAASVPPVPLDCASPASIARLRDVLVGQARSAGGSGAMLDNSAAALSVSVAAASDSGRGDGRTLVCRGLLSLPAIGGAAPLAASIEYRIRPAAGGAVDVSAVSGAAPIVMALVEAGADQVTTVEPDGAAVIEAEPMPDVPAPSQPAAPFIPRAAPPPAPPVSVPNEPEVAGPSFDCGRVTSRVLEAVCSSPRLAALDVEMSELFFALRDGADRNLRDELDAGRDDFIAQRQSCRDNRCIARVYRDRIEELETYR
ncbi:lysozyme inhibitor LprI family protein [Glacieibacterium frigidum]|uniref:Lysozyme inhibitor LprI N-terminal domain-containing protein n=1 Tax=Glacieibacterium frigidum TaxID=2593303 RepID=A0A552UA83_9SPHN|nr:hypothetical protein [Glacieibacterium frigidum]TRW15121.1 hypothetical protein FMM06_15865 [Glacieibacterium frigidum]